MGCLIGNEVFCAGRPLLCSEECTVAPATIKTPTLAMTVVFAFAHAIDFITPLIRVKVELLAVAPWANAAAVTDFASTTGVI